MVEPRRASNATHDVIPAARAALTEQCGCNDPALASWGRLAWGCAKHDSRDSAPCRDVQSLCDYNPFLQTNIQSYSSNTRQSNSYLRIVECYDNRTDVVPLGRKESMYYCTPC
jgi:hypothetical protein